MLAATRVGEKKMSETWKQWQGQTIPGNFYLREYLASSDHSAVFLTEHGEKQDKAAIKLLPAGATNAELQVTRWALAATLSHPNLLRIFQYGRCQMAGNDLLFVVMEYAEENLGQILPQRPLTIEELRQLLLPTLEVLTYLHAQGIVHGGVKPSNILALDNQVKLSVDNLRRANENIDLNVMDPYGPPESDNGVASPATDIWSLGMTVVAALTQHLPETDGPRTEEASVPSSLPAPFYKIARNCLLRAPQQRWTIAEIAAALDGKEVQPKKMPVEQTPTPQQQRLSRWHIAVPVLVVATIVAIMVVHPRKLNHPEARPETVRPFTQQTPASSDTAPAPISSGDARPGTPSSLKAPEQRTASDHGTVHKVVPNPSIAARNTIHGHVKVRVRVHVNPAGSVTHVDFESRGPSPYFARLAMEAAQDWTFVSSHGTSSRQWVLRFDFARAGTKVLASQNGRHR